MNLNMKDINDRITLELGVRRKLENDFSEVCNQILDSIPEPELITFRFEQEMELKAFKDIINATEFVIDVESKVLTERLRLHNYLVQCNSFISLNTCLMRARYLEADERNDNILVKAMRKGKFCAEEHL